MKIRTGFVSNSSSSSFIVLEKDVEKIKSLGISVYKALDCLYTLEKIETIIGSGEVPQFMICDWDYDSSGFIERLKELIAAHKNVDFYITEKIHDTYTYDPIFETLEEFYSH